MDNYDAMHSFDRDTRWEMECRIAHAKTERARDKARDLRDKARRELDAMYNRHTVDHCQPSPTDCEECAALCPGLWMLCARRASERAGQRLTRRAAVEFYNLACTEA